MQPGANGRSASPMRVAVPTSELTAQQRSARVDQLVVDVNALKAFVHVIDQRHDLKLAWAMLADHDAVYQARPRTFWQRMRWLFRG